MQDGNLFQRVKHLFHAVKDGEVMFDEETAELIKNIFRYMDKDAKDIMTHRRDIVAIDGEMTLEDTLHFMLEDNYSRFPVFGEDIDEILGVVHFRDVVKAYLNKELRQKKMNQLKDCIRSALFIPETKSIDTLFKEMQSGKNHMAVVVDEYGQTSGIVAMEDILEEIVGNIMDEYDEEEEEILYQSDGSYVVNGLLELEELEDLLEIEFDKEEFETLNGFLVNELDRIPSEEEQIEITYSEFKFTILSVDNNAIQSVRVEKIAK